DRRVDALRPGRRPDRRVRPGVPRRGLRRGLHRPDRPGPGRVLRPHARRGAAALRV
ncbi:MAG: hypothetical protein AVDCRST_MAG13-1847, partial [uncultured Solirubrobacteraceae bacterium]